MDENADDFWQLCADELVGRLDANQRLKNITNNPELTGAFAEATVRSLAAKMAEPYRTSTGSIFSHSLYESHQKCIAAKLKEKGILKQIDLLIWSALPIPAIFDESGFAIVPWLSVLGALEVKRTSYTGVGRKMTATLDWVEEHSGGIKELEYLPNGDVATFQVDGKKKNIRRDHHWLALGVVCVKTKDAKSDSLLDDLVKQGRAVILLEEMNNGDLRTNVSHVIHLVNFLAESRRRAHKLLDVTRQSIAADSVGKKLGETPPGPLRKPRLTHGE